jgi:5-methylcytosine-specific restriction protein A
MSKAPPMFVPGEFYRRRDLHAKYGGQRQGGISTPTRHPMIFLFTGESGHQYGYHDGPRDDGTFWYTGEGQVGDMQMKSGNQAISNHELNGKTLYLFEIVRKGGQVQYLGEATYLDHHVEVAPDRNNTPRKAIVFRLSLDSVANGPEHPTVETNKAKENRALWEMPLEKLRDLAASALPKDATPKQRIVNTYYRSEGVRVYVLRRANGRCEACDAPAPFATKQGQPYLEPHHIRRRADGGPDHPRWVAGICPNCHRRVHFAKDGAEYNERLAVRVGGIENTTEAT